MVKSFRMFLVGLLLLVSMSPVQAALRATVSPSQARIGDVVVYSIQAEPAEKGLKFELPEAGAVYIPAAESEPETAAAVPLYEILSVQKDEDLAKLEIRIAWYRPGKHQAPVVRITDSNGELCEYDVPVVDVIALNEKGEFAEIDPPADPDFNYWRLLFVLLGIACVAGLAWFGYRLYKKYRSKKAVLDTPPDAKTVFLDAISDLKNSDLLAQGQSAEFVFRLSGIFRSYLASIHQLNAPEMTGEEILAWFDGPGRNYIRREYIARLRDLFSLWDLARYAELCPPPEILQESLRTTVQCASLIKPMEVSHGQS